MNNYFKIKNISSIVNWVVLILLSTPILTTGCQFYTADRITVRGAGHQNDEQKTLERGYMAFQIKDFKQADKWFSSLQSADNKEISRKAQYALACTKWALAETLDAEKKAFARWEKIRNEHFRYGDKNEFKLLETLLETVINRPRDEGKLKKVSRCQSQLYLRGEVIKQLNQKIKAMKGEVLLLKKKIKTIEEIDQKIQEKKEDPPPP